MLFSGHVMGAAKEVKVSVVPYKRPIQTGKTSSKEGAGDSEATPSAGWDLLSSDACWERRVTFF